MDKSACTAEIRGRRMEMGVGGWFNSEGQARPEKNYKCPVIQEAGVNEGNRGFYKEKSKKQIYHCCKGVARHSQANWKRAEAYNVVLDHWRQNTVIILHSLDLSLFMSLFLVLPVLTLNDTEQKGDMISKMTPTFIFSVGTRRLKSWYFPAFHAGIYPKFKGNCFGR